MAEQSTGLFSAALTTAEMRRGIRKKPAGRKRACLVVTDKEKDFADVKTLNPLQGDQGRRPQRSPR
jgi:hypothetical protein